MTKQVTTKTPTVKRGDVERKVKRKQAARKRIKALPKNTKFTTKNRSRNKKGR